MKSKIIALLICMMFVTTLALAQEATAPAAAPAAAPVAATAPAVAPAVPAAADTTAKAPAMLPLELRKTGIVSVTKDASGKTTAIKLIVTSYDIQLDDGSKPLEAMDGQKVRVTCTLSHEGGKRILTVKSVEPVAEGGTAPAAGLPAAALPAAVPAATPAAAPAAEKPAEAPAVK